MKTTIQTISPLSQDRYLNNIHNTGSFYDRIVEADPISIGLTVVAATTAYMLDVPTIVIGVGVGSFILYKTLFARSVKTVVSDKPDYNATVKTIVPDKPDYNATVNRVIKSRILVNLQAINQTFAKAKKETIQYNEQDSIDQLATQAMQGYLKICETGLKPSYIKIVKTILTEEIIIDGVDNEALMNGAISWITLQKVYESDKKTFPTFRFKKIIREDDILVKEIDLIIDNGISNLKIILEKYFSIFRLILDPRLKLQEKISIITNYNSNFNLILELLKAQCKSTDTSSSGINLQIAIGLLAEALSNDIFALQNVLECLYAFKKVPRTLYNLEKGKNILHSIYNNDYKKISKDHNGEQIKNRLNIQSILNGLTLKLSALIKETETQIQASLEEERKRFKKKKVFNPSLNTESPSIQNKISNNNSLPETVIITPLTERKVFEIKEEKEKEYDINIHKTANVQSTLDIITPEEDLSDDDLEDIEPETIVLMETIRQFFEKDRAIKLQKKEEKAKKAKIIIEGHNDLKIKTQSENQILGSKHQTTLAELFQAKPSHLTISGKSVRSLIKALGGKSIGATGSQFTIFWHGSNKHAGEYEITHGGDTPGFLTSGYATRVADAIHIGLKHACIAKELFPLSLLPIIENRTISNNG